MIFLIGSFLAGHQDYIALICQHNRCFYCFLPVVILRTWLFIRCLSLLHMSRSFRVSVRGLSESELLWSCNRGYLAIFGRCAIPSPPAPHVMSCRHLPDLMSVSIHLRGSGVGHSQHSLIFPEIPPLRAPEQVLRLLKTVSISFCADLDLGSCIYCKKLKH